MSITVAPISFCYANERSNALCEVINEFYLNGLSTKEIAKFLDMSTSSVRRYYYGVHQCSEADRHWRNAFQANKKAGYVQTGLNQVRIGACVPLAIAQ